MELESDFLNSMALAEKFKCVTLPLGGASEARGG